MVLLWATQWCPMQHPVISLHAACSASAPCTMAAHHSTQKQNKATTTPFLAAPTQPRLLLSNLVHISQATTKQQQTVATQSYLSKATSVTHNQTLTVALKQNLQCHESRWFSFLHPQVFCTSCWQAATHGPVLNRSVWRRSGQKGTVGFLAEPGMMPKAAKSLSSLLLA